MPENEPANLFNQAQRCRALAQATADAKTRYTLLGMAREYEQRAAQATKRK